jgi:hypothetical protein
MRFRSGERFVAYDDGTAATASITLTASTRGVQIDGITAWAISSNAVITVQASGTTIWGQRTGSACVPVSFTDLAIENGTAGTLSANVAGATSSVITLCGTYRL